MKLTNRVAIVTGASSGIGKAIAIQLSKEGASLAVCARNRENLEEAAKEIGKGTLAQTCDAADEAQVSRFVEAVHKKFGRIDILVNNAGEATSMPLKRMDSAFWHRIIAANLHSVYYFTSRTVPRMMETKYGRIINIASISGKVGDKYLSAYSAAKHAVLGFTKSLAIELLGTGITINAICPGFVDTPATEKNIKLVAEKTKMSYDEAKRFFEYENLRKKFVTPEEVAHVCLCLASDDSGSITGDAIDIW